MLFSLRVFALLLPSSAMFTAMQSLLCFLSNAATPPFAFVNQVNSPILLVSASSSRRSGTVTQASEGSYPRTIGRAIGSCTQGRIVFRGFVVLSCAPAWYTTRQHLCLYFGIPRRTHHALAHFHRPSFSNLHSIRCVTSAGSIWADRMILLISHQLPPARLSRFYRPYTRRPMQPLSAGNAL